MEYHEHTLRHFLLGELDEAQRRRLEQDLLEDPTLFERVEAIDGELILDFEAGQLSDSDAAVLRARLAASAEGRRTASFHRLLASQLPRHATLARRPSGSHPWTPLIHNRAVIALTAAMLTLGLALPIFDTIYERRSFEPPPVTGEGPGTADTSSLFAGAAPLRETFLLAPLTRSDDGPAALSIRRGTELVELWLDPAYRSGPFRFAVEQAGRRLLAAEVAALEREWGPVVPIEIPAEMIEDGALQITLERFEGTWSPVASYSAVIDKK